MKPRYSMEGMMAGPTLLHIINPEEEWISFCGKTTHLLIKSQPRATDDVCEECEALYYREEARA